MKFSLLSLLVLSVACSGPFKATENSTEFFKANGGATTGFVGLNGGVAAGDNGGDNGAGSASGGTGTATGGVGSASGGSSSSGGSSASSGSGSASGGEGSASGGTASGGSESGGTYTGGYNGFGSGGSSSSGGAESGSASGGTVSGGAGSASGGESTGGGNNGNANSGGAAATGSASGGTVSGGASSSGGNSGGYNGFGTGGSSSSGGAETGSASGGTVSGGASTSGGNNGGYNGFGTGGSSSSGGAESGSSSAGGYNGGTNGTGSASGGTVSGGASSSGGNSGGYNGFGTGGSSSSGGAETGSSSAGGYNGGTGGTGSASGGTTGGEGCNGKVKVCHREGNGSSHTIEIACPALPAHLAHGDVQGECSNTSGSSGGGYVCDPMDDNPPGSITDGYGLIGDVWDGKGKISKFEDATKKGDKMPYTIYMSQLNVPTRLFNEGFAATDGKLVMNSNNQPLFENFAIEFTSNLVLRPEDEEGYYQIGTLADDGVRVEITPINDKQMTLAQADFDTPTKFTCGKKLVRMERDKKVPVRIRYFQGPRFHISLVMMWRKVKNLSSSQGGCHHEEPPKEVKCGIAGNKYWFDPDSGSTPTPNYLELLDPSKRQVPWKLVQHQNFKLNNGDSNEECQD